MKKTLSLFLALIIFSIVLSGNVVAQTIEGEISYSDNIIFEAKEKIEYTYSETEGTFDFLGVEAKAVIEKEYDDYWHYRIVATCDSKLARKTIRENFEKDYPNCNYSLTRFFDPREYAYIHNNVYVSFVEPISIPDGGEPFELYGVTVQKVLSNIDNCIFEFEYSNTEDASAAFDAFLQSHNVVYTVRTGLARDVYNVGDLNGDKAITKFDYILLKRHIMGTYWLGAWMKNADINADSVVNMYDYLLIKRHIMGTYEIDFILKDNQ